MNVAMSANDANVLSTILQFYELHARHKSSLSLKHRRHFVEVQWLNTKMKQLSTRQAVALTYGDIDIIESALRVFSEQVIEKIPPALGRDEIAAGCERLRAHIVAAFHPALGASVAM